MTENIRSAIARLSCSIFRVLVATMACLSPCGAVFAQQQAQAQPAAKTSVAEDDLKYETLKVRKEGAVLFVEIAAPPMNLLGPELVRDLVSLIQRAEADNAVKVLVFKSADPDYFISHVDVTKIKEYREEAAKLVGSCWHILDVTLIWHSCHSFRCL